MVPVGGHLDAAASTSRVEHLEERLNKVPFGVGTVAVLKWD